MSKDASTTDLTGFEVQAGGETVGRIHNATNEVDVSFIVVDAALQRVLLPAGFISDVDARRRKVTLSCTAAEVRGAPRFDEQHGLAAPPSTELIDDLAADGQPEGAEATKDEVYAEAGRLDVRGRSTMTKDELIAALRTHRKSRSAKSDATKSQPPKQEGQPDRRTYEERSVEELRDRARELQIEGRSAMSKDELVASLRKQAK